MSEQKRFSRPIITWNNQPAGLVMTKTTLAFALCFLTAYILGNPTTAFQAGIATVLTLKEDRPHTYSEAINRTLGTIIAGALAYGFIMLTTGTLGIAHGDLLYYALNLLCLMFLIAIFFWLRRPAGIICSVVVFLLTTHLSSAVAAPFPYVAQRTIDTVIGIAVAMLVNWLPWLNKKFKYAYTASNEDAERV